MKKVLFVFLLLFFACPIFVLAEQIDINSSSLSQLDDLTGIGPKYAQAIIDARPFLSVDDLVKVKGIGPKTLQKIKDQGFACVNCQIQISENSSSSLEGSSQRSASSSSSSAPAIVYPNGVVINEIMPNPKGADETDEWIELYNQNNFDVDLSAWQIQDTIGTIKTYAIPAGVKILANGFFVLKRPDTNIMLNNDKDGLNLLTPDGKTEDSVSFVSAPLNQSYNKTSSGWQWSETFTPGAKNALTVIKIKTALKTLPNEKNSVKNNNVEPELADISQPVNATNPWFLFLTALAITVISAIIVLLIKLRFKNHVRT
jgi:competence ComEA-like helix-hairpin-helix protein